MQARIEAGTAAPEESVTSAYVVDITGQTGGTNYGRLLLIAVALLLLVVALVSIYFATTDAGVVQGWTNVGRSIGLPIGTSNTSAE